MIETNAVFEPDWISPPGETIADVLEERDWTQRDLARRLGYSTKHVSQLVTGKAAITEETALRFERVLGGSAGFWLNRETRYRERIAREREQQRLEQWTDWLDELPVRGLMNAGAIPKRHNKGRNRPLIVDDLLRFFGVASPDEWRERYGSLQAAFRRSRPEQSNTAAIAAWLRMGEREAERMEVAFFDRRKFEANLRAIRTLTREPPEVFAPRLVEHCRRSGVAVVFVPAIRHTHVSGVARWRNPHCAMVQLSLYGKWNDRMWFTFFHEAAHILLHGRDKKQVFLDDSDGASVDSDEEREANEWAGNFLIPPRESARLASLVTVDDIKAFAEEIDIHPGIVVGRMQHERLLDYATSLNRLKERFELSHGAE